MAFLPAMTLLEGELLPIVLNLLNNMVNFGNTFKSIFTKEKIDAIVSNFDKVISEIAQFFTNHATEIADLVVEMINLLPSMLEMQKAIIQLFVDNRESILT